MRDLKPCNFSDAGGSGADSPVGSGVLSSVECRRLDRLCCDFQFETYKALRDPNQLYLLEIACSQESILSREVEKQNLRVQRCSWWNNYDLCNNDGLRRLLNLIDKERPDHVWISTECTAFSPIQNINQRNVEQCQHRESEKKEQRKQHVAALVAAYFAHSVGCTVHWEWARRCRAWKWDLMDRWRESCGTTTAIISSCQVNLRDPETNKLFGKEWRIESTSPTFARNIHCPCPSKQCRDNHADCLGSNLRSTAFYSPEFARRVVHHMLRDDQLIASKASMAQRQRELQELQDIRWDQCNCSRLQGSIHGLLCPKCLGIPVCGVEKAGEVYVASSSTTPFTQAESERVMKQLHHLHRATGHGSYESLIKSLEHRKADPRVLDLARKFKCCTCEERKRPTPRRLANLEVNTQRGKVIQMDAAWWAPDPKDDRNKCQFVVFIDEASRFAVGRVFRHDGGGHLTAKTIISTFHELWEPCFGLPELLRADPDGACRSRELDQHFQGLGVETDNIPADAHWKVSVVERSIQWVKELMSKGASDEPSASHEALLAQALRTWNQREPVRGYSPYQWMLGRAPDFEDRMFTPNVHNLPGSLLHQPEHAFHRSENLRKISEKAFVDWQYREKLSRARNAKVRDYSMYMPGDLVFFWRLQGKARHGGSGGIKKGAYAGPARILAMETKQQQGHVRHRFGWSGLCV